MSAEPNQAVKKRWPSSVTYRRCCLAEKIQSDHNILIIQKTYKSFDYKFYGDFSKKQINEFVKTQQKDFNKILKFLKIKKISSELKYKVY